MKKGYLIAIDLDGTLVIEGKHEDTNALNLLKEIAKDNYVIISTGRPLRGSLKYYNYLNLNTPIINYNGALVHSPIDPNFNKIMLTVNKDYILDIFNTFKDDFVNIFTEIEDDIYLYKMQDDIKGYLHLEGGTLHVGDLNNILINDPNGAICFTKFGSEERLTNYVNTKYKGELLIRFYPNNNYAVSEIYSPLTTKGEGLSKIIKYLNVPFEKTISIGDGHNDLEMFEVTKINVAMENGHKDLLEKANVITKSVYDNGVYEFLKEYFKN